SGICYFSTVVIKLHGQEQKEGFIWGLQIRGVRVHHHHCWDMWQQAPDMTVGMAGEGSLLEPQTGSRENELQMAKDF
ncbi:hypothetical protein ACQP3F_33390, partial [Escherichia coli]